MLPPAELKLWRDVMAAAVQDLRDPVLSLAELGNPEPTFDDILDLQDAAEEWVREPGDEPGAFEWVCWALGLNANATRRALL